MRVEVISSSNTATPVFLSTVTPGKFPTFWLRPVKELNKEDLPLLGFPTNAIFTLLRTSILKFGGKFNGCNQDMFTR
jgi:hypothetical protein